MKQLLAIDWDNGFHIYAIDIRHGRGLWGYGYTAHLALMPLYSAAACIVYVFHGSTLDGVRLANALSMAIAASFLRALVRTYRVDEIRAFLIVAFWMTASDSVFLIRTVEDDCIGLAAQAALAWAILGGTVASSRRFLFAGLALGFGFLTNYACIVWLPIAAVWLLTAPTPSLREYLGRLGLFFFGLVTMILIWGVWSVQVTHDYTWQAYRTVLSISPNSLSSAANHWDVIGYFARYLPVLVAPVPAGTAFAIGESWARRLIWLLAVALLFGLVFPWRRGIRRASERGRALSLACLAAIVLGLPTAVKNDWTIHERLDHLPLLAATVLGLWMSVARESRARAWVWMPTICGTLWVLAQATAVARIPPYQSKLGMFEEARLAHRRAPVLIWAEQEFGESDYDALVSILASPRVRVLSPHGGALHWRFPVPSSHLILLDDWRRAPVEGAYLSDQARALAPQ